MEKVDRLGWVDGLTFSPSGANIGFRINSAEHLELFRTVLNDFGWQASQEEVQILLSLFVGPPAKKGRKNYNLLYIGASQLSRSLDLDEVLDYLRDSLPNLVRATARDRIFVPGAIIEIGESLLVLPATADTGRRTLMKEFENQGAQILCHDFFAINPDGTLRIQKGVEIPADQPKLVCFTEYSSQNKTLRARRLTPGEASLYLFSFGVSSRSMPALALNAVSSFAKDVVSLRGKRGEAKQAVKYLTDKVSRLSRARV